MVLPLFLVSASMGSSLVVAGVEDRDALQASTHRMLVQTAIIVVPLAVVMGVLHPPGDSVDIDRLAIFLREAAEEHALRGVELRAGDRYIVLDLRVGREELAHLVERARHHADTGPHEEDEHDFHPEKELLEPSPGRPAEHKESPGAHYRSPSPSCQAGGGMVSGYEEAIHATP